MYIYKIKLVKNHNNISYLKGETIAIPLNFTKLLSSNYRRVDSSHRLRIKNK